MPITTDIEQLTQKHYITLVLRLVVDEGGRLAYGEVVDVAGQPRRRFVGWGELTGALQAWLVKGGDMTEPSADL